MGVVKHFEPYNLYLGKLDNDSYSVSAALSLTYLLKECKRQTYGGSIMRNIGTNILTYEVYLLGPWEQNR